MGAIRIGGPGWLKAVVGRARENRTAAEVELTTSTSPDVCELWNGTAVVRTVGSPKIIALLHFHGEGPGFETTSGLFTVEEAVNAGLLEQTEVNARGIIHGFPESSTKARSMDARKTTRIAPQKRDEELGINLATPHGAGMPKKNPTSKPTAAKTGAGRRTLDTPISAPNVSLNLYPTTSRSRWEIYIYATIGVVVQAGVLTFACFVTFNTQLAQQVGGEQGTVYGCILATTGTLVLVVGMLVCAFVVESSTQEISYKITEKASKFRVLWVQRGETVGDQGFDSYVIFGDGERDSLLSSRIVDHNADSRFYAEAFAMAGTAFGIIGFVVQFTGLRAINWSVSVAQLAATGIMAVLRAVVRRDMGKAPHTQKLPSGYELEWLATRLASDPGKLWRSDEFEGTEEDSTAKDCTPFWSEECINFGIVTASDSKPLAFPVDVCAPVDTLSTYTVRMRARLGWLSKWSTRGSDAAIDLAKAMEVVMNALFPPLPNGPDLCQTLLWPMRTITDLNHQIRFSVNYNMERGTWEASSAALSAVISLWLYAAQKSEDDRTAEMQSGGEADWVRAGDRALRQSNIKLLGPATSACIRDLKWYASDAMSNVVKVKELPPTPCELSRIDELHTQEDHADSVVSASVAYQSNRNARTFVTSPIELPTEAPPPAVLTSVLFGRVVGIISEPIQVGKARKIDRLYLRG